MRRLFSGLTVLLAAFALSPAFSETREDLIAQIETGGRNEYADERHAVEVDECQLTTYRWKHLKDEGWVLWTSFEFPMLLVDLAEIGKTTESRYFAEVQANPPHGHYGLRG